MRTVTFCMDPSQYERLQDFAEEAGMNVSELIRETLDDLLNVPPEVFCCHREMEARERILNGTAFGQRVGNA